MIRKGFVIGAIFVLSAALIAAQGAPPIGAAAKAWFGQPLPGPANDGVTPAFDTVHTDIGAAPATFGPGPNDPELQEQRIKADLRNGDGYGQE